MKDVVVNSYVNKDFLYINGVGYNDFLIGIIMPFQIIIIMYL